MKILRFIVALLAVLSVAVPVLSAEETIHAGTVIYAKTAGNYTYIRLKEGEKKVWLATSPLEVSVGDPVEYAGGDVMTKFESKAMKKTYDSSISSSYWYLPPEGWDEWEWSLNCIIAYRPGFFLHSFILSARFIMLKSTLLWMIYHTIPPAYRFVLNCTERECHENCPD